MARTKGTAWLPLAVLGFVVLASFPIGPTPTFRRSMVSAASAATLQLSSYQHGESPLHRIHFDIEAGEPERYLARLEYPEGFTFTGFHTLGPAGTAVGAYELDVDFDGTPDTTRVLRSLGPSSAYVDLFDDTTFDAALEPLVTRSGDCCFELRLPFGGDANVATLVSPFGARASLVLGEGVLVNPPLGGAYTVVADVSTVDPDTGGPDDGGGLPPTTERFEFVVNIDGPVMTPFKLLAIQKFDVQRHGANHDRVHVQGHFAPGRSSDGLNLREENVTVSFDGYGQTLPGSAFSSNGGSYQFHHGAPPGIEHFWIWSDGRFQIDIRGLRLGDTGGALTFSLRIGNDAGDTTVGDASKPRGAK